MAKEKITASNLRVAHFSHVDLAAAWDNARVNAGRALVNAAVMVENLVWVEPARGLHVMSGLDTGGVAPGSPLPGMENMHEAGPRFARAMQDRREEGSQGKHPISDQIIEGIIGKHGQTFLKDVFLGTVY